jgi:hypothetical protein
MCVTARQRLQKRFSERSSLAGRTLAHTLQRRNTMESDTSTAAATLAPP